MIQEQETVSGSALQMDESVEETKQWDITICPPKGWVPLQLGELWTYRELLFFFIWRNIKIRYKQTLLGALWAVIQPFFTMVVFSIFFGQLAGIPSDGIPYPVFAFVALVPWTYFAGALTQASNSVVEHERTITKIYFPRLLLPISSVLSSLLDLVISMVFLVGLMFWFGLSPTLAIWTLPFFILMTTLTALGSSIWLAALNVKYRDVRYVTGFLVQLWLFATPVAYSSSLVPESFRGIYGLNPMTGVVEGFRWALLGRTSISLSMVIVSLSIVVIVLIGGLYYFRRTEETFADIV
jgi:lipopolysaccharide transport system permease protein